MTLRAFTAAVRKAVDQPVRPGDAPVIHDAPDGVSLADLVSEVTRWAGRPRNLAAGGFTDPTITENTGLALVEPFGAQLLEMRGWAHRSRWIGCGEVARPDGARPVVVLAAREAPAHDEFPQGHSWAQKLQALTGWVPGSAPAVDWPAVETALGTALPRDYKEVVDVFGAGSFDEYIDLLVPGYPGSDLVSSAQWDGVNAADMFQPYSAHPATGGLLRWGGSEQEIVFCWLTGADDPDDWPVLVQSDFDTWERYDCGFGEFVVRLLSETALGFPVSHAVHHHFVSWAQDRSSPTPPISSG